MSNDFIKAMKYRFACKSFDANKKISTEDKNVILEAGLLSPSSFGLEPTRLIISENAQTKQKLREICWGQKQLEESALAVILSVKIEDMKSGSSYVSSQFERNVSGDAAKLKFYLETYAGFQKTYCNDKNALYAWCAHQAYLMAGNMMSVAAFIGIDSCAIESFEKSKMDEFLAQEFGVKGQETALVLTFGYRASEPKYKSNRISLNDFVKAI